MSIRQLSLTDFRSYRHLDLTFGAGPNVVLGRNAAGKTNLVEAIVVLSRGRSHRSPADPDLVRWGCPFSRAAATVTSAPDGPADELEVLIHAPAAVPRGAPGGAQGTARKRIRVNGVNRRPGALAGLLRTVLFAPEDMLLIAGSPSSRRATLDALVVQREPTAASVMSTYSRVLTQRNSLLRRVRDEAASRDELAYWDDALCLHGARIRAWRREALSALAGPLAAAHDEIAPGEDALGIRYDSNVEPGPAEDDDKALRRRLREIADKEVWNGATLVGPHRDDIVFAAGGRDLASFASRGQQRSAILALKFAEVDALTTLDGRSPLLLLDDVFSELDPERRAHLVRRIDSLPQAIVTTTTADDLDPSLLAVSNLYRAEGGTVHPGPATP